MKAEVVTYASLAGFPRAFHALVAPPTSAAESVRLLERLPPSWSQPSSQCEQVLVNAYWTSLRVEESPTRGRSSLAVSAVSSFVPV